MIGLVLYHFCIEQIRRSEGDSAIASAAYRAGERLYSSYYGETSDYTHKGGVIHTEIFLPPNAPAAYLDRETLWNEVEIAERGRNAQLAYSVEITLQNEFSMEENIEMARTFVQEQFVSRGMIADLAIHDPEKEGIPNPHFHVMTTMRPIQPDGSWGFKQHRVHKLDEQGNRLRDADGKLVFNAVPTTDWGRPETLEGWREAWCRMCNAKFEEKQLPVRIDHRSYARQGIDQIPTVHEGPFVRKMEALGVATEKGDLNRWIRQTNKLIAQVKKNIRELVDWLAAVKEELDKPQMPALAQLLSDYCAMRNAVANTYGYGKQKAKVGNLKHFAEAIAYLTDRNIQTVDELEKQINGIHAVVSDLNASMKAKSERTKELQELIRCAEIYTQHKPLVDEMNGIHFKGRREKFREAHDSQIRQFFMAKRTLEESGIKDGVLPVSKWKAEVATLEKARTDAYAQYKSQREELTKLLQVKRAVDTVLKSDLHHENNPKRPQEMEVNM